MYSRLYRGCLWCSYVGSTERTTHSRWNNDNNCSMKALSLISSAHSISENMKPVAVLFYRPTKYSTQSNISGSHSYIRSVEVILFVMGLKSTEYQFNWTSYLLSWVSYSTHIYSDQLSLSSFRGRSISTCLGWGWKSFVYSDRAPWVRRNVWR
jgi:hypothetical protein